MTDNQKKLAAEPGALPGCASSKPTAMPSTKSSLAAF
jgi:hypothetical protein